MSNRFDETRVRKTFSPAFGEKVARCAPDEGANSHRRRYRNLTAASSTIIAWLATSASNAFAHGGMASADDLARPLGASVAIAFVCYWVVMLWPSRNLETPTQSKKRVRRRRSSSGANNGLRPDSLKMIGRGRDG